MAKFSDVQKINSFGLTNMPGDHLFLIVLKLIKGEGLYEHPAYFVELALQQSSPKGRK